MELSAILGLISPLKEWFAVIKAGKDQGDEKYQEALGALYTALNETRIYLGSLDMTHRNAFSPNKKAQSRTRETEEKLSRLWTAASLKLRKYNRDLAQRCLMKGDYWANPDSWSEEDIKKARIGIDKVFKEAQKLL